MINKPVIEIERINQKTMADVVEIGFSVQSDPTFPRDTDPSVLTTISGFTHTGYW